ncbi:hypothetical protein Hanom_Chr14g01285681 [Helianthus anomalus]
MQQIHNINTINTTGGHFLDNNITTNMPLLKLRISNSLDITYICLKKQHVFHDKHYNVLKTIYLQVNE